MNILQVSKVKVVDTPIVDTRLVLNWTSSSTKCSTSHWLPQSAPQLPLVVFETLCWNWKLVMSNLGSLTSCYSHFFSYQRRVAIRFGCAYLKGPKGVACNATPPGPARFERDVTQHLWSRILVKRWNEIGKAKIGARPSIPCGGVEVVWRYQVCEICPFATPRRLSSSHTERKPREC
jgi:hypothetical protein